MEYLLINDNVILVFYNPDENARGGRAIDTTSRPHLAHT